MSDQLTDEQIVEEARKQRERETSLPNYCTREWVRFRACSLLCRMEMDLARSRNTRIEDRNTVSIQRLERAVSALCSLINYMCAPDENDPKFKSQSARAFKLLDKTHQHYNLTRSVHLLKEATK